jgi:hypothetical protein
LNKKKGLKCDNTFDPNNLDNQIECAHDLLALDFNTDYKISLSLLSASLNFEWPTKSILLAKTRFSLPKTSIKTYASYEINANIKSNSALSIVEPLVDERNGPVLSKRLYLVKLGTLAQQMNRSELFSMPTSSSTSDQAYLSRLINETNECSNETVVLEPCLLKLDAVYSRPSNEKIVLVGKLASNENVSVIVNRTIVSFYCGK